MPIVNYVREHIRFIEYASDEHVTASERLLWYALMHIMNQRAQGNVWPDEFIRISNDRLISLCPMKFDTLAAARNGLKQRGLIEYIKGDKNIRSPAYRMVYFYPVYLPPKHDMRNESYTEISYNMGGNVGGNMGDNTGDKAGGNAGDILLNYTEPCRSINRSTEEEEELERARVEAAEAWLENYGAEIPVGAANALARMAAGCGFDRGMLTAAIQSAAVRCAESPVDYIAALLDDWREHGVKTPEALGEYQLLYDASRGKSKSMGRETALARMFEMREASKERALYDTRKSV